MIKKKYDAIKKCKSAGIIPYCHKNGETYFLLQKNEDDSNQKYNGWNDFGGKRMFKNENTFLIASREFSEETSCLFYLNEKKSHRSSKMYNQIKNGDYNFNNQKMLSLFNHTLFVSQKFFYNKINNRYRMLYLSSKEVYISYLLKVNYIPAEDLPIYEDIHIHHKIRYKRICRWFSYTELMNLDSNDFHKRLQITKIQQKIIYYHNNNLLL